MTNIIFLKNYQSRHNTVYNNEKIFLSQLFLYFHIILEVEVVVFIYKMKFEKRPTKG